MAAAEVMLLPGVFAWQGRMLVARTGHSSRAACPCCGPCRSPAPPARAPRPRCHCCVSCSWSLEIPTCSSMGATRDWMCLHDTGPMVSGHEGLTAAIVRFEQHHL